MAVEDRSSRIHSACRLPSAAALVLVLSLCQISTCAADDPSLGDKVRNWLRRGKSETVEARTASAKSRKPRETGNRTAEFVNPPPGLELPSWQPDDASRFTVARDEAAGGSRQPNPATFSPTIRELLNIDSDPAYLQARLDEAYVNNPTIVQAAALVDAAMGRWIQAGRYPNPFIGYSGSEIGNDGRSGQQGFLVSQEIVRGGKLELAGAVAEQEREQAAAQMTGQLVRVVSSVRSAFFEALAAQLTRQSIVLSDPERPVIELWRAALNQTNEELRRAVQAAVEAEEKLQEPMRSLEYVTERSMLNSKQRLKAGEGTLADVLQAEIELQQVRILAANSDAAYVAAWRRLGAVIGRPELAPQRLTDSLELTANERERLNTLNAIVAKSPERQAAEAGIRRAVAALARAQAEPIPNLTIEAGTQYDFGSRTQIANVGISFPLPISNRNDGNIMAAQSDLARARSDVDRVKLALAERFAMVYGNYQKALQQTERYGHRLPDAVIKRILEKADERQALLDKYPEILPRAQLALALATEGWQRGEYGYLQVLTAQRTLTQISLDYIRAHAEVRQSVIALNGYLLSDGIAAPGSSGSERDY